MNQALAGLKVIEYAQLISGPFCAKLLADLGAEVIKVEPLEGDSARSRPPFKGKVPHPESSGLFLYLNSNKLGLTLNLYTDLGKEIFQKLISTADILIEDGTLPDIGIDYATLSQINPRLIITSITAFGLSGPYHNFKANDLILAHMGGMGYVTPDWVADKQWDYPLRGGGHQADFAAGLAASLFTMAAVFPRQITGKGLHLDISEFEIAAYGMDRLIGLHSYDKVDFSVRHRTPTMELPVKCRDGHIEFHVVEDAHWKSFLEVMGNPAWGNDPAFDNYFSRCENWSALEAHITKWTQRYKKATIARKMQSKRAAVAPVNNMEDVVKSKHLKSRNFFQKVSHPYAGRLKYPGAPHIFSQTPATIRRPAPLLGEHNKQIICDQLGYSKAELLQMRESRVI